MPGGGDEDRWWTERKVDRRHTGWRSLGDVWVAVPWFPELSVALQDTTCGFNRERAGVTGGRRQRPIDVVDRAVAEPRLTGVIGPVASTMTSAGGVTRGGLVSN